MDMNGAYEQEVHFQCPLAEIVYDLFHVVAKYGREVLDQMRFEVVSMPDPTNTGLSCPPRYPTIPYMPSYL